MNTSRGRETNGLYDMSMDLALLTSPRLYSLKYTVLCPVRLFSPLGAERSEFPVITRILQRSKNLRVLRLGAVEDSRFKFGDYQEKYARFGADGSGALNLCLRRGDVFPPLEELTFSSPRNDSPALYSLTPNHCFAMERSMDLTALKVLDLGRTASHIFFANLNGCVPNLKSLSFTMLNPYQHHQSPVYVESVTADFLGSLSGLEELHINNDSMEHYPKLWPIVKRHASTLQKLSMDEPDDQTEDGVEVPTPSSGFKLPGLPSSWKRKDEVVKEKTPQDEIIHDHNVQVSTNLKVLFTA